MNRQFTPYDQPPPEPTWADYAADRVSRWPTWARVFLAVFAGLLVLAALIGVTAWLFIHGWIVTGVIGVCASVAAWVTLLAALVTDGFTL